MTQSEPTTEADEPIEIVYDCTPRETAAGSRAIAGDRSGLEPSGWRGLLGWVLFIGLAVGLFFFLQGERGGRSTGASSEAETSGAPSTWLGSIARMPADARVSLAFAIAGALCLTGGFALLRVSSRERKDRWRGQIRYLFGRDGVTNTRPGRQDTFAWSKFIRADETPTLVLLFVDSTHAMVFPKRLFASEDDLPRLRRLLQTQLVRPAIELAHGFPVQPSSPGLERREELS